MRGIDTRQVDTCWILGDAASAATSSCAGTSAWRKLSVRIASSSLRYQIVDVIVVISVMVRVSVAVTMPMVTVLVVRIIGVGSGAP